MLVSPDGETSNNKKVLVKIIDFGLAKAVQSQSDPKSLTHDKFVGTPAFASPEQFEHSALDVRSDIYSLGETLWFALTGKRHLRAIAWRRSIAHKNPTCFPSNNSRQRTFRIA
jgi:serine/threonine-protein kinase